ncbi:hypothetical protein LTR47_011597 [Exophiala xenobiotica]|nr:hypothetical protein LTR92_011752 [Exophiala xenobiotica]KAK5202627.1 hypothetical protein LTR41_011634 [Exophiala xenobiotica]KAK5219266.1 hypothetical protein LTR47_011597 [Exophiala xenobiotica]KAK5260395.1 hypothetical protein LTR40_004219 [Exophiala xenobiotica]KAK5344597.1 hypothetical protein LTR61_011625 [Exophiala xenobiotica]
MSFSQRTTVVLKDQEWAAETRAGGLQLNSSLGKTADTIIKAIMDPKDDFLDRLWCPRIDESRYSDLQQHPPTANEDNYHDPPQARFYFALNLHQCASILPRLMGSIMEAILFLGPENCVLSIVGAQRDDDGTTEILSGLRDEASGIGLKFHFKVTDIDPLRKDSDRVADLAKLRNAALAPLLNDSQLDNSETTFIFLNDISLCAEDILELVYQRKIQQADMTCALDWIHGGRFFYDVWIARGMSGDLFFEIPQSGSWEFAENLFWNDPSSRSAYDSRQPFQVYACWNGAVALSAKPFLEDQIRFRAAGGQECVMGEPTLLCKDFWTHGHGRIAVIPSVNVGYSDEESRAIKVRRGYVSTSLAQQSKGLDTLITWKGAPPDLIKCQPSWNSPSWVAWNQGIPE